MLKRFTLVFSIWAFTVGNLAAYELPFDGRTERAAFVSSLIKPGDIGLEIGVQMGIFAYHVLVPNKPLKLYLVDPWIFGIQGYETGPTDSPDPIRQHEYDSVCQLFKDNPNVHILRMKSDDAAPLFENNYFDYVYIDGEHSYKAVLSDLNNYFPKVKIGGYIIGDDYGWSGIADAVQEFIKAHADELIFLDDPYSGRTGGQFAIRRIK